MSVRVSRIGPAAVALALALGAAAWTGCRPAEDARCAADQDCAPGLRCVQLADAGEGVCRDLVPRPPNCVARCLRRPIPVVRSTGEVDAGPTLVERWRCALECFSDIGRGTAR